MYLRFLSICAFTIIIPLSIFANSEKEEEECCPNGKQHYRVTFRHIESGGIGYKDGYTTLETFLALDPSEWKVTPFIDAKGHVFDNGKWAANAGIGIRTLWGNRTYGINTYYDYRNAGHFNSNQIGVGIETLGELLDFRINGYFPVGTTISNPYNATFAAFSGNYMLISQNYQSAMIGTDTEFGFHFGKSRSFECYAAAGPYYFTGKIGPSTWGGKARISTTFKDFLTLEISDSYDNTFHNKFQGQISLNYFFGSKSKIKEQGRTCKKANTLNDRMLQPVGRQEIIVIDDITKNTPSINPTTGLPYFFVFVNNTSNSNGTYESPYHSLLQAEQNSFPNDIIYVFPGDGTTRGMDSGIFLKANQQFWGSGINHSLLTSQGTISIPAQSSSSPTITNTNIDTEGNAITLATNNFISGFTIPFAMNNAIYGTDCQNLDISSCTFKNTTTFTIYASFSGDSSISLRNNQFLNNSNGVFLILNGTSSLDCFNNTFTGQTSTSSIPLTISAFNNAFIANIETNEFNNNTVGSIQVNITDVQDADINIFNNTFTNNGTGSESSLGGSIVIIPTNTTNICSIALNENRFSGNISTDGGGVSSSLYVQNSGQFTTFELTVSNNTISNNEGSGLVFAGASSNFLLNATNNTLSNLQNNGIAIIGETPFETANITLNKNTITDITGSQNGIVISQPISTLNFTVEDNTIDNCAGSGILCFSPEFTNMQVTITGNVINNCQNPGGGNAGSGISLDNYVNLTSTIENNTLSNNTSPALSVGFFTPENPNVCLTLKNNTSNTDPSYSLTNPNSGNFNLSPCNVDSANVGTISSFGTINLVQSCSTPTPCPP